jgi:hypothetical protein
MPQKLATPYCILSLEVGKGILRFTRTEVPFPHLAVMIAQHERVARILDRLGRDRYALLVDMRLAPRNTDPGFDAAAARSRRLLTRGFTRMAVLVSTAVGALQVKRHIREDNLSCEVFTDELAALDHLDRGDGGEIEAPPPSGVDLVKDGPFGHLAKLTRGKTSTR